MLQHYSASIQILAVQIMTCNSNQDCSDHGNCIQTCFCYPSYSGDTCSECKSDDYQMNKDGFCLQKCDSSCTARDFACLYDSDLKMNLCNCAITNSNPDENCNGCIDGYQGTKKDNCQPKECVNARKLCGDEGSCEKIDGKFACVCNENYIGTYCDNCKNNLIKTFDGKCLPQQCVDENSEECSGFGTCDLQQLKCVCNHGYENNFCQDCAVGFKAIADKYGQKCQSEVCFFEDDQKSCSGSGICITQGTKSFCDCDDDKSGEFCQNCSEEYEKLQSGKCLPRVCAVNGLNCAENGNCVLRNNSYKCSCLQNYDDATNCSSCVSGHTNIKGRCIADSCIINDTECSNHGYCLQADSLNSVNNCACNIAYKGEFCDECKDDFISLENGDCTKGECITNNTECNNNGTCEEQCIGFDCNLGWGCSCDNGFGPFCENCYRGFVKGVNGRCIVENCISAGLECGGHGVCQVLNFDHFCVCEENFTAESRCVECVEGFVMKDNSCGEKQFGVGMVVGICVAILVVLVGVGAGVWVWLKVRKDRLKQGYQVMQEFDTEDEDLI